MLRIPSLCVAGLLALGTATAQKTYFAASLDGSQETPPVTTTASGFGVVAFDAATNKVDIFVFARGLTGTAAHMHQAASGVAGAIIVPLSGGADGWSGSATLTSAQATALQSAGTYVNVHTAANPGGEIRGQVVAATSSRFEAALDGAQETPPTNSTGTGTAICFLHEPDNVLTYVVTTQGLSSITAAHIHIAPAGQPGPIIHPLNGGPGTWCGVTQKLDATQLAALKSNGLYFNVHTSANPGGEIRGQILSVVGDFFARLDGSQETPPVTTNAIGQACLTVNPNNTVTYLLSTSGLSGTAAHIHKGARGTPGPILIPFTGGPTVWSGTSQVLTAADLTDARNGLWYANAHTSANPGGEIRGQVQTAELPTTFGGGCVGTSGKAAEIGTDRAPCVGAPVAFTESGAKAGLPAVLLLGSSRDLFGTLPLPLNLKIISAPGCFALINDAGIRLPAVTDANGCINLPVAMPFNGALRDVTVFWQWFLVDAGANALGLISSNALATKIQ